MRLSLILEAVDRITAPVRRVEASMKRLTDRAIKPVERALQRVDAVEKRVLGPRLVSRIDQITSRATRLARIGGRWALEAGAYGAGRAIGWTIRQAGLLALRVGQIGLLGASAGTGWFVGGIISQASKFEQFQVVLENTEGSAERARIAMAWVKDFAKTTPYEIGDVMEAFVALKAYGIDPTNGSLRSLGDAASGMGKPIMQAVEALADAQTGEFERLKEFGIRSKKQGEMVTFTYQKAGREITRTAKMSAEAINAALTGIMNERFAGMMDRQSRTLAGMWSNLMDTITGFQLDVAAGGVFDLVKDQVEGLLNWVNEQAANGNLKKWAEETSKGIEDVIRAFTGLVDTEEERAALIADLKSLGSAAVIVARGIVDLVRAGAQLIAFFDMIDRRGGAMRDVVAASGVLGSGAQAAAAQRQRSPSPSGSARSYSEADRKKLWLQPAAGMAPAAKPGLLEISVRADRGTEAWPSKVAPGSTPLSVNTGKPMWGDQ